MFTVKLSPNLVSPVAYKLVVFTVLNVTLSAVATWMPPAPSSVKVIFLPVTKLAVLSVLLMVLTSTPSICVTTVCKALSAFTKLSLVALLKSTT